jgi:hypothetical protein
LFCNRCAYPFDEAKVLESMIPAELSPRKQELNEKLERISAEFVDSPEVLDKLLNALILLKREGKK